jgi:peroxiredoxin
MRKTMLLAGCLLLWGAAVVKADPTVAQMLSLKPSQPGVDYTTPSPQEENGCKVERVNGDRGVGSGYVLRDPRGQHLRRFYNSKFTSAKDKTNMDLWSYYKDGVEVYREWATHNGERANNFRWMNAGGMKWGVDVNGDGKIDAWKMISAEEASQEILQAIVTNDTGRLQALMITDGDLKALELPAAEAKRLRELQQQAVSKFQATVAKLTNLHKDKTRWMHLETSPPQCLTAEATGLKHDIIKYRAGTILCETAGKNDWIQTGEMVQVGFAWRLVDAPTPGLADENAQTETSAAANDPELKGLFDELNKLDGAAPKETVEPGKPSPIIVAYNTQRAALLQKIVNKVKPEEADQWIRQIADSLSTAAQVSPANDKTAYNRLVSLADLATKQQPKSDLTAYLRFREMSADYAVRLASANPSDGKEFEKTQKAWIERLAKFVQDFPKAEDVPDALMQLGMTSETLGDLVQAKNWFQQLATNYGDNPLAAKASGAARRLDAVGKPFELTGQTLDGQSFNASLLKGRILIVYYYWTGFKADGAVADLARLKVLLESNANKNVELVCVNLDNTAEEAAAFVKKHAPPGTHLHQKGGLESPLATQYGIFVLPTTFVVDKDGKVVSSTVQVSELDKEVGKLLEK